MENEREPRSDNDEFGRAVDEDITDLGDEDYDEEDDALEDEELDSDDVEGR